MTYGSLFTGIGGLDLALEAFGHTPLWQAECDPYARAVLAKHWPGVHCYRDVREIDEQSPPPDIICGGFPCQDISDAGLRGGIDGERSGLWREFARVIRLLRPSVVFVENVAALTVRGLGRVLGDLAALGFDAEWQVLLASDVGAPHRRERIFILAYAAGAGRGCPPWLSVAGDSPGPARVGTADPGRRGGAVADSSRAGCTGSAGRAETGRRPDVVGRGDQGSLADADSDGCEFVGRPEQERGQAREQDARGNVADRRHRPHIFPPGPDGIARWDGPQPAIRRGDDGVPGRSHRLRQLGNACIPQQAALAFSTLVARAAAAPRERAA